MPSAAPVPAMPVSRVRQARIAMPWGVGGRPIRGFGVSIRSGLVESHGGTIRIDSRANRDAGGRETKA